MEVAVKSQLSTSLDEEEETETSASVPTLLTVFQVLQEWKKWGNKGQTQGMLEHESQ